jgi:hypothetical protein
MSETYVCPCMGFDLDEGAKTPDTCFCGDTFAEHHRDGCRAVHDANEPYNPEMTAAALRLVRRWHNRGG